MLDIDIAIGVLSIAKTNSRLSLLTASAPSTDMSASGYSWETASRKIVDVLLSPCSLKSPPRPETVASMSVVIGGVSALVQHSSLSVSPTVMVNHSGFGVDVRGSGFAA